MRDLTKWVPDLRVVHREQLEILELERMYGSSTSSTKEDTMPELEIMQKSNLSDEPATPPTPSWWEWLLGLFGL